MLVKHFTLMVKKKKIPYDQRLARILVKPISASWINPNHITTLTLLMALVACILFATGDLDCANWAAGIFVLARFFDHFDGELAREQGSSSRFGYYFDYVSGGVSYAVLFVGLGIGYKDSELGFWAIILAGAGSLAAIISLFSNLGIDKRTDDLADGDSIGYPAFAGIELEDGIYLLAPVTWFGYLTPFFIASGIGAIIYCLWTIWTYFRLGSQ